MQANRKSIGTLVRELSVGDQSIIRQIIHTLQGGIPEEDECETEAEREDRRQHRGLHYAKNVGFELPCIDDATVVAREWQQKYQGTRGRRISNRATSNQNERDGESGGTSRNDTLPDYMKRIGGIPLPGIFEASKTFLKKLRRRSVQPVPQPERMQSPNRKGRVGAGARDSLRRNARQGESNTVARNEGQRARHQQSENDLLAQSAFYGKEPLRNRRSLVKSFGSD